MLEEEAVDLVIGGSNNDEVVATVVWGDDTIHEWGVVPGGRPTERLKADLELVGIFGLDDEITKLKDDGLSEEKREQIVGKVQNLRETCEQKGVPRRSILGEFSAFCNGLWAQAQAAHLKLMESHNEHYLELFRSTAAMFEKNTDDGGEQRGFSARYSMEVHPMLKTQMRSRFYAYLAQKGGGQECFI